MDPVTIGLVSGGVLELTKLIAPIVAKHLEKNHHVERTRANHAAMIIADEIAEEIRLAAEKGAPK